ncbi:SemiSWEET transporter [Candidatus Gottesmanbacteria bacterium]|nr:SemiSWEET transporter [Candidatus Gottesmanbacteria bacterium]MBI5452889.1 SemiSWEET transporter [Candidatus Gottesmanbacteria bacterium]
MNLTTIIGLLAAIISTVSFSPQVIKCWQTKRTKDISFPSYSLLAIGVFFWVVYGLFRQDIIVFIANLIILLSVVLILLAKLKYG